MFLSLQKQSFNSLFIFHKECWNVLFHGHDVKLKTSRVFSDVSNSAWKVFKDDLKNVNSYFEAVWKKNEKKKMHGLLNCWFCRSCIQQQLFRALWNTSITSAQLCIDTVIIFQSMRSIQRGKWMLLTTSALFLLQHCSSFYWLREIDFLVFIIRKKEIYLKMKLMWYYRESRIM